MAKRQTRRSISLNCEVYEAAKRAAEKQGKSLGHFIADALRIAGVDLPATTHMTLADAQLATQQRAARQRARSAKAPERREGPIRRALGDKVADSMGEP